MIFLAATSSGAACGRRALILTAAALSAGVVALMGGVGGASATSLTLCTTTTSAPTLSPASVVAGQPVTYTATVTTNGACANGNPTGTVGFFSNYGSQAIQIGRSATLEPVAGTTNESIATLTDTTLPTGSYAITASYTSNSSLYFDSVSSTGSQLIVQSAVAQQTAMSFSGSPLSVQLGQTIAFTVSVSEVGGSAVPTGDVAFSAGLTAGAQVNIGSATLVNGTATFSYGAWGQAATFIVIASYPGNLVDRSVSGQLSITVSPGASPPIATSTSVAATQSTLSAHVAETLNGAPPPAGGQVQFSVGTSLTALTPEGTANTDANGNATIATPGLTAGTYYVRAQYVEDDRDSSHPISGSSDTTTLFIPGAAPVIGTNPSAIAWTGGTTAPYLGQTTLSARLTSNGQPLVAQTVTLAMGSQTCSATTDAHGDASCPAITVTQDAGSHPLSAQFDGNAFFAQASTSGTFTVDPLPTATSYTGDTSGTYGSASTVKAHLTSNGSDLGGKPVALYVDGQTCTTSTDSFGIAMCTVTLNEAAGPYGLKAEFVGDTNYTGSEAVGTFTVLKAPTATTYTGATSGVTGGTVTLSADATSVPDGATVTFTLGSQSCPSTVSGGHVSCPLTLTQPIGTGYTVIATYAGNASHRASSDSKPFTIAAPVTTTQAGPVAPVLVGSPAILTATVSPAEATGTVTFAIAGKTLCTSSLSSGAASCSPTFSQPGSYTVTATYDGDGVYPSSSDTTTVLVYAFAPGGGSFVIGDKSASGSVTFWGSPWWKANDLSGGPAPSAFKGFALNGPATCGATWSTDPGNSSPPPAGPLPAYMAVIVTSASTQSGAQISGTIASIVIVKTDAGYDANPGHAGTGTVVATVCGG